MEHVYPFSQTNPTGPERSKKAYRNAILAMNKNNNHEKRKKKFSFQGIKG